MLMRDWRGDIKMRSNGCECFKGGSSSVVHWVGVQAVQRKYQLLCYNKLDGW